MTRNYFQALQIKQAKEQRQWVIYCQKVKRYGIKNLYPDTMKPRNPETDGC